MDTTGTITIPDLLRRSRPLTGAASLHSTTTATPNTSTPPPPPLKRHRPTPPEDPQLSSSEPSTANPRPLTPLMRPTAIVGIVELPSLASPDPCGSGRRCLGFSDGAARVCCDVLEFDLRMVGRRIRVLAWNFIPLKKGVGGLLEIVRWTFVEAEIEIEMSMPLARGILRSVGPVFAVPRSHEQCGSSKGGAAEGGDSVGFLAELAVCECGLCGKAMLVRARSLQGKLVQHSFTKSVFVYFYGPAFSWHPVLCKLVGRMVEVSGLKKKKVFVGEDESYLMLVSTEKTVVCKSWCLMGALAVRHRRDVLKIGEGLGTYDGVVTGIYMKGMVVELDEKVWLLLTDPLLSLPHSFRVGAIISARNVHILHSNLSWIKVLLLGACIKTTLLIKSFSPFSTECIGVVRTQSLLGKFIDLLTFSAKFWVLLLVSCLRKKFRGVFSDKEILGSKNKEGLAHIYANSHLPSCVFQRRDGVFMEFCKHDDCGCKNQPMYTPLELVAPLSNFINYCKAAWTSILLHEAASGVSAVDSNVNRMCCEGYSYDRLSRRFIPSKDLGVILMGSLQNSSSTKRLQLFDRTGSIDVVVPDLPPDIDTNSIYEVKDYQLIIEGLPAQIEPSSSRNGSLSCRSIFQHLQLRNELIGLTIYIHFYLRDSTCLNKNFHLPVVRNIFLGSNSVFHLLLLTHKFPASHDGNSVISDGFSAFAESSFLPYDLMFVDECKNEYGQLVESITRTSVEVKYADWLANSDKWSEKPCSIHLSHESSTAWSNNSCRSNANGSSRIPCLLTLTNNTFQGFLVPSNLFCVCSSGSCKIAGKQNSNRFLLEFRADAFSEYQSLHVGAYYILKEELQFGEKHHEEYAKYGKVTITSQKSLWRFSFSPSKTKDQHELQWNRSVGDSPLRANDSMICNSRQIIFFNHHWNNSQSDFGIQLHVSSENIESLKCINKLWADGLFNSIPTQSEVFSVSSCIKLMRKTSLQPSGTVKVECRLPEGTIISLCGNVMDVHFFHSGSCIQSYWVGTSTNMHREGDSCVCIHVYENDHMVKIQGRFGKHSYPLGVGPGANVVFHRLLMTCNSSRWYKLILTPASFIMVNSVKEVGSHLESSNCPTQSSSKPLKEHQLNIRSFELIFRSIQPSEDNVIRINCRVDRIILLVLEKQTHQLKKGLRQQNNKPSVKIPFAGFVMDDGSSSFCCWADSDRAGILLRLQEPLFQASVKRISKRRGIQNIWHTSDCSLDKILKKHHRVSIENYEAMKDPKCVDFTFSVNSSKLFSCLEEKFLKSIVFYACRGPMFEIVGTVMDLNALGWSKKQIDVEVLKQLDIQNFWVREVNPVNFLAKTRNLLDELLART